METSRQNLTTGTIFTIEEVCRIIKESAEHGVFKLEYGQLRLEFSKQDETVRTTSIPELSDDTHKAQNETALVKDELEVKQDRLANMFIENPLEAENLIQDLEDSDDESEDE